MNKTPSRKMDEAEKLFEHKGRAIRYEYRPSTKSDAPLLIVLHGHMTSPRATKLQSDDWNILVPIDDFGANNYGSWFLGEDGDHFWLEAMPLLVSSCFDGDDIYVIGSSMGGYGAILYGIRLRAKGVFANIPQTRLLGSTYAEQGMEQYFAPIFGEAGPTKLNDLKNLVSRQIKPFFVITAMRWDKKNYLEEQILPFISALIDADIEFSFEILPEVGHKMAVPFHRAAERMLEIHRDGGLGRNSRRARKAEKSKNKNVSGDEAPSDMDNRNRTEASALTSVKTDPDALDLVRRTFTTPESVWPENRAHMAARFQGFLDRYASQLGVSDHAEVCEHVIDQATRRGNDRPMTVFINNPGGSGSHWLQGLLEHNISTTSCGEVYMPPPMMNYLAKANQDYCGFLLDCMHLAHSYDVSNDMTGAKFVNTAHGVGWTYSRVMPDPKTVLLLTRDPLKTVLSRTFRKHEFRATYFPEMSDAEFLDYNIKYVANFYKLRGSEPLDGIVRYEDLKRDVAGALRELASVKKLGIDLNLIEGTATSAKEGQIDTNKYKGRQIEIPTHLEKVAKRELRQLRSELGYI